MAEELKVDVTLNLEGLLCPIPVVKLSQAMKQAVLGGVIEAHATDPGVMADIPAWCKTTGNELIKMEREGKKIHFFVRKVK